MNDIPQRQNSEELLSYQAAARALYRRAQVWSRTQLWLSSVGPVAWVLTGIAFALAGVDEALRLRVSEFGALYGLAIMLVDELVIEPRIDRNRKLGASAQQTFDMELFALSGRDGAKHLDAAAVAKYARVDRNAGFKKVVDWYPKNIGPLPLSVARVICQRTNIWWDSNLRGRYFRLMIGFAIGVGLAGVVLALLLAWDVSMLVLALATVSPVVRWSVRNGMRQRASEKISEEQYGRALALEKALVERRLSDDEADDRSRDLQDEIYERRRSAPVGVAWIYKRSRSEFEAGMRANAEATVRAYGGWTAPPGPIAGP